MISSNPGRIKDIEAPGAKTDIGRMEDVEFLTATFKGADIVYCMETPEAAWGLFNPDLDYISAINKNGNSYKKTIEEPGVKKVIHLSSVGAHTEKRNGILVFHYNVEHLLRQLPEDVSIKFMRPASFYNNMFSFIRSIELQSAIISNYGGDIKDPWVSPLAIADAISEEMESPFSGITMRYIASDELSPNEIAKALGKAIGIPDLQWQVIPDEQLLNGTLTAGMNSDVAKGFVEMQASQGSGAVYEDYKLNKPSLGKKLNDFAKIFATVYNKSK